MRRRSGLCGRRPGASARPGSLVRRHGRQPCRRPRRPLRLRECGGPQALTDYIRARKGYDYAHHGKTGNPSTDFVPDEVIERFCLLGPRTDHVARIRELESLGVDQYAVYLMHDQMDETLASYGQDVIPAFR